MNSVLGWELRRLAPFTLLLLVLEALLRAVLSRAFGSWTPEEDMVFRSWILLFAAALYGSLFFGLESPASRGFLLRMPIARARLLAAKASAALIHLSVLGGLSALLLRIFRPLLGGEDPWRPPVLVVLLAYVFCAWLSTWAREALTAFVLGPLVMVLSYAALLQVVAETRTWTVPLALVGLGALGGGLWRRLETMEDRPDGAPAGRLAAWGRPLGPYLLGVEWRQKRFVLALLVALPALSAVLSWRGSGPLVVFFWAPLAGAVLGVLLWTEPERDGVGFFLHHLPIARWKLVLRRAAVGLGFGAVFLAEFAAILWLYTRWVRTSLPPEMTLHPLVYQFGLFYAVAFGLGAMLSPWTRSSLVGAVLALLTLLALVLIPGLFAPEAPEYGWHAALVAAVWALAWWSSVYSRGLEPVPGKNLRPLWLLLPFWVLFLGSLLI